MMTDIKPSIVWLRIPRLPISVMEQIFKCNNQEQLNNCIESILTDSEILNHISNAHPQLLYSKSEFELINNSKVRDLLLRYLIRASSRSTPNSTLAGITALKTSDQTTCFAQDSIKFTPFFFHNYQQRLRISRQKLTWDANLTVGTNPLLAIRKNSAELLRKFGDDQKIFFSSQKYHLNQKTLQLLRLLAKPMTIKDIRKELKIDKNEWSYFFDFLKQLVDESLIQIIQKGDSSFNSSIQQTSSITLSKDFSRHLASNIDCKISLTNNSISTKALTSFVKASLFLRDYSFTASEHYDPWINNVIEHIKNNHYEQRVDLREFISSLPFDLNPNEKSRAPIFSNDWIEHLVECDSKGLEQINLDEILVEKLRKKDKGHSANQYANGSSLLINLFKENAEGLSGHLLYSVQGWKGLRMFAKHAHLFPESIKNSSQPNEYSSYVFADLIGTSTTKSKDLALRPDWIKHKIVIEWEDCDLSNAIPLQEIEIEYGPVGFRLFWKTQKKFIIPVITTNYNITKDPNPYIRLLACIGLNSKASDQTPLFFPPGRHFNPRLTYKGVCLSPKTWIIKKEDFIQYLTGPAGKNVKNLPNNLCMAKGDQKLPIRLDNPFITLKLLEKEKSSFLVLEEDLGLYYGEKVQVNQEEYKHEILFDCFEPNQKIISAPTFPPSYTAKSKDRIHQYDFNLPIKRMDDFLIQELHPFLKKLNKKDNSIKFYFVKYPLPAPQIRLRIIGSKSLYWDKFCMQFDKWRSNYSLSSMNMTPFQMELGVYKIMSDLKKYHELSCILSEAFFQKSKAFKSSNDSSFNLIGSLHDLAYIVSFASKIGLNSESFQNSDDDINYSRFRHECSLAWKILRAEWLESNSPSSKILNKLTDEIAIEVNEILIKTKGNKDFLKARLIHMEVFRLSLQNNGYIEKAVYVILNYLKKSQQSNNKNSKHSLH